MAAVNWAYNTCNRVSLQLWDIHATISGMAKAKTTTWITLRDAIELTGYNDDHLRELLRFGMIAGRKFANVWMVDKKSLLAYLRAHQKTARKDKRFGPHSAKED
jgi:hypothetical protein